MFKKLISVLTTLIIATAPFSGAVAISPFDDNYDIILQTSDVYNAEEIFSSARVHLGGNVHPRILTNSAELLSIKANKDTDVIVSKAYQNTINQANAIINLPVVEYELPDNIRLLESAREVMNRCVTLSVAYLLTDNDVYAERIWTEFTSDGGCFTWKDWNAQRHYLDNSELLYAVAVAFDSCYAYWCDEAKSIMMAKAHEYSLSYSVDAYKNGNYSGSSWMHTSSNWGIVCNSSIISACLAFGLEGNIIYQADYNYLLPKALDGIAYTIEGYAPDGGWHEGLRYWEYSTRYLSAGVLAPLYFSTGDTLGFINKLGIYNTIDAIIAQQNAIKSYNYHDNGLEDRICCEAAFVIPLIKGDNSMMKCWADWCLDVTDSLSAMTLMFYRPASDVTYTVPLDSYIRGIEVGSMKEASNGTNSSCVFYKGGVNDSNSHFDSGSFCFDSMGIRWSMELGKGSYNIDGGYAGKNGLSLYIKRPEGHNAMVINPREDIADEMYGGQAINSSAVLLKSASSPTASYAVLDLSDTYKYDVNSYHRGFYLGDNRRTLIIRDEIDFIENNSEFYWFMHTKADVLSINNEKHEVILKSNNKTLKVTAVSDAYNFNFRLNKIESYSNDTVSGAIKRRFPTDSLRNGEYESRFASISVLTIEGEARDKLNLSVKLEPMDGTYEENLPLNLDYNISSWTVSNNKYIDFANNVNGMVLSPEDKFYIDTRLTDGFSEAKLYLGDTLVSTSPKVLSNGNYRFELNVPADFILGKSHLYIKAKYSDIEYTKTELVNIADKSITLAKEYDFNSIQKNNGQELSPSNVGISEMSYVSYGRIFTYDKENVAGNSTGKLKFNPPEANKYSYIRDTSGLYIKNGINLSFDFKLNSSDDYISVDVRPNNYYFSSTGFSNIPIIKNLHSIDGTKQDLDKWHRARLSVTAVSIGAVESTYEYSYTLFIDDVLCDVGTLSHLDGKRTSFVSLGLLLASSSLESSIYIDNFNVSYYKPTELYNTINSLDDNINILPLVETSDKTKTLRLGGIYTGDAKNKIYVCKYIKDLDDDFLKLISISEYPLIADIQLKISIDTSGNEICSVYIWDSKTLKPCTLRYDF